MYPILQAFDLITLLFKVHCVVKKKKSRNVCVKLEVDYSRIAFDERVTFWLQRARLLPHACVFAALYACAIALWLYASLTRKYKYKSFK